MIKDAVFVGQEHEVESLGDSRLLVGAGPSDARPDGASTPGWWVEEGHHRMFFPREGCCMSFSASLCVSVLLTYPNRKKGGAAGSAFASTNTSYVGTTFLLKSDEAADLL